MKTYEEERDELADKKYPCLLGDPDKYMSVKASIWREAADWGNEYSKKVIADLKEHIDLHDDFNFDLQKQIASRDVMIEEMEIALKNMADANFNKDTSAHKALAELNEWKKNK